MRQDIELNEHRQFAEALVELRPEVHRAVPCTTAPAARARRRRSPRAGGSAALHGRAGRHPGPSRAALGIARKEKLMQLARLPARFVSAAFVFATGCQPAAPAPTPTTAPAAKPAPTTAPAAAPSVSPAASPAAKPAASPSAAA